MELTKGLRVDPSGRLGNDVCRKTVGGGPLGPFPDTEVTAVLFGRRPQPGMGITAKLLERSPLGPGREARS